MVYELPSLPEITITVNGLELELIDLVTDITFESQWGQPGGGGGSWELSYSMPNLDPNFNHPQFKLGADVEVQVGSWPIWAGKISAIDRSAPWRFTASGYVQYFKDFMSLNVAGNSTSKPDDAIDRAISVALDKVLRRVPFGALGNVAYVGTDATAALNRLDSLLNAICVDHALRWQVDGRRLTTAAADPVVPKWHLLPDAAIVGVLDSEFYTTLKGRYIAGTAGDTSVTDFDFQDATYKYQTATVSDAKSLALTGEYREYGIDLRALGPLVPSIPAGNAARSVANALLSTRLPLVTARVGFTNSIKANWWEILTPGGIPAPLWQIQAGDMVRVHGVIGEDGNLQFGTYVDIVASRVIYTAGESSIQIDPLGLVARDFTAALADAVAPAAAQTPTSGINPANDGWFTAS